MYTILLRPQKHTVKNHTPYFCLFLRGHWTSSVILYGIRFMITQNHLIHRTFTRTPLPPTPTPPPTSCSSYINNFLLSGNRLSFHCYSRNLNLFCNFRNQVVGSKALIFHFSHESFLLSCFFIHIWRISHL